MAAWSHGYLQFFSQGDFSDCFAGSLARVMTVAGVGFTTSTS